LTATNPIETPTATPTQTATLPYSEPTTANLFFTDFAVNNASFNLGTNTGFGLVNSFTIAYDVNGYDTGGCEIVNEGANGSGTFPAYALGVSIAGNNGLTCTSTHFQRGNPLYINGNPVYGGGTFVSGNTTVTVLIDADCDSYAC
jgi:hypothetical protein